MNRRFQECSWTEGASKAEKRTSESEGLRYHSAFPKCELVLRDRHVQADAPLPGEAMHRLPAAN